MKKSILVIDDEDAIRKSFLLSLEDSGYQVYAASSGEDGLELFKKEKQDLVFLDLKMPGMNGVETLRAIRKIDTEVPIYIVTAFYREFMELLVPAAKDGIRFEIANKPIDSKQITAIAKAALESPSKI